MATNDTIELPPLPPGFKLDQPTTSLPPLPPGFKLDAPGQIQDLNPTEDPTQVWQGSLGRTLASQVQRGKGWLQQPIVRLPRVNLEDPRVNVTPGAAGFFNKAAEDVEGLTTLPNLGAA